MADKNNVIDLSQRRTKRAEPAPVREVRLKLDPDQARALVTTTLLSVLLVVGLANNSLFSGSGKAGGETALSSQAPAAGGDRSIASVPSGTSRFEEETVARLSKVSIQNPDGIGRSPSALERLTVEFLEGRYTVQLENGRVKELAFVNAESAGDGAFAAKRIEDRARFLESNRELLPVEFTRTAKLQVVARDGEVIETYDLLDASKQSVAKVRFQLDTDNRLIAMTVLGGTADAR